MLWVRGAFSRKESGFVKWTIEYTVVLVGPCI